MKISVCIPAYNQAKYLKIDIRSDTGQTFTPSKMIFSEDCSVIYTHGLLHRHSIVKSLLKLYKLLRNLGLLGYVNTYLRLATLTLLNK